MIEKLTGRLSVGHKLTGRLSISRINTSYQPVLIQKQITENGSYSAEDDNADGYSCVIVDVPIPPETVLTEKTITENGNYSAASDNADGYSSVTVNVQSLLAVPIARDLDTGYVDLANSETTLWVPETPSLCRSDVYRVKADTRYVFTLTSVPGTRFRILFSEDNPVGSTQRISGISVNRKFNQGYNLQNSPQPYAVGYYTTESDGYITITKDNKGTSVIKLYVFEIPQK